MVPNTLEEILKDSVVVMIDDNEVLNNLYKRYFLKKGVGEFRTFTDPEEGLNYIKQNPPHLLILDMRLPKMHGAQVLDIIKKYGIFLPVIINSGFSKEEDAKKENIQKIYPILAYFTKEREEEMDEWLLPLKNGIWLAKMHKISMLEAEARTRMIQSLAAGIKHEINNPISSIVSGVNYLKAQLPEFYSLELSKMEKLLGKQDFEDYAVIAKDIIDGSPQNIDLDKLCEQYGPELVEKAADYNALGHLPQYQRISSFPEAEESLNNLFIHKKRIDIMERASNRIIQVAESVGRLTGLDKGETVKVDLNQTLDDAVLLLEISKSINIIKNYQGPLEIMSRPAYVSEIVINLLKNAKEAMKENGVLELRTYDKDNYACLEIKDNGPGIPDEIKDKIFDPLFTTKLGENKGIGLFLVQYNVRLLNGKINFNSKSGETVFEVLIPKK